MINIWVLYVEIINCFEECIYVNNIWIVVIEEIICDVYIRLEVSWYIVFGGWFC